MKLFRYYLEELLDIFLKLLRILIQNSWKNISDIAKSNHSHPNPMTLLYCLSRLKSANFEKQQDLRHFLQYFLSKEVTSGVSPGSSPFQLGMEHFSKLHFRSFLYQFFQQFLKQPLRSVVPLIVYARISPGVPPEDSPGVNPETPPRVDSAPASRKLKFLSTEIPQ